MGSLAVQQYTAEDEGYGYQDCHWSITITQLISLVLLAALLVAFLVKDHLCRRCPWDWTLFQGNCYFFSTFQKNWKDSVTACKEVGAQLVIKSDEEQSFLQQTSKKKGYTWIGLSDIKQEGEWLWVDGSPLKSSYPHPHPLLTSFPRSHPCEVRVLMPEKDQKRTRKEAVFIKGFSHILFKILGLIRSCKFGVFALCFSYIVCTDVYCSRASVFQWRHIVLATRVLGFCVEV
ncbi:hypothetical protein STEG23_009323 [Scotinomys teguina]